ncbi:unnamed protein product [Nesidiocoris tenuis]|uniref:Uncharacterized protein n=1 Tax=Nesidiocoris tenuis TaxID=355587 RepID=A0A6H5HAK6_9HEMI|nr:unnamed protein product [Nesidiocoris tenuis]
MKNLKAEKSDILDDDIFWVRVQTTVEFLKPISRTNLELEGRTFSGFLIAIEENIPRSVYVQGSPRNRWIEKVKAGNPSGPFEEFGTCVKGQEIPPIRRIKDLIMDRKIHSEFQNELNTIENPETFWEPKIKEITPEIVHHHERTGIQRIKARRLFMSVPASGPWLEPSSDSGQGSLSGTNYYDID